MAHDDPTSRAEPGEAPGSLAAAEALCGWLDAHGIAYRRFDHAPVFTCEETELFVPAEAVGVQTKNLFLRDKRGRRHWLVVTTCTKAVDIRALAPRIGGDRLTFGSPERLMAHLGVTPGSVTVLALARDPEHRVELWVDREVWEAAEWRCHPMINSSTLVLTRAEIERFLRVTGHEAHVVDVPRALAADPPSAAAGESSGGSAPT